VQHPLELVGRQRLHRRRHRVAPQVEFQSKIESKMESNLKADHQIMVSSAEIHALSMWVV
jgi:hypothetical protein